MALVQRPLGGAMLPNMDDRLLLPGALAGGYALYRQFEGVAAPVRNAAQVGRRAYDVGRPIYDQTYDKVRRVINYMRQGTGQSSSSNGWPARYSYGPRPRRRRRRTSKKLFPRKSHCGYPTRLNTHKSCVNHCIC